MLRAAFPDLHFTIHDLVAEGETVAARVSMSGTDVGVFLGQPPTGRRFEQDQMHFVRFEQGKAVEHWAVRDDMGLLIQLGITPDESGAE